ncbi:hypothetical protein DV701_10895 [Ornithinimicrobium avium]|uniref:4'-phosphopantetheinyl transferase n=1 Tax=Ornithinimicrobium avium TaxID=2283195 RepID=A0A345NNF3_9MICO|nr:hypothetical protein DV701_10895 [Ornithinimicrobium avium]
MDVHLWWADLTCADAAMEAELPAPERARLERLTGAERARRAVGAALLQHAVQAHRARSGPVVVDRTCEGCGAQHGRPVVEGGPHVSVAHAGVLVVVATCQDSPVGIDVERVSRFEGAADARQDAGSGDLTAEVLAAQAWVGDEARLKAGTAGAVLPVDAPLRGYAAALCVAGEESEVRLVEHR